MALSRVMRIASILLLCSLALSFVYLVLDQEYYEVWFWFSDDSSNDTVHALSQVFDTIGLTRTVHSLSLIIERPRMRQQIIFVETTGKATLNARQACAVESAAKENPNMDVVLYVASSFIDVTDDATRAVTSSRNVKVRFLDLDTFFLGTKLEEWYLGDKWRNSSYKISHMSDALRFLLMYEYGGIYLDLDVVVIKSMKDLRNCAGLESPKWTASGVMAFDVQHVFLKLCLDEFAKNYNGNKWGYNGPELFTRVLMNVCKDVKKLSDVTREKCIGVKVMPQYAFYAIPWQDWEQFFEEKNPENVLNLFNSSYLIHVWNKHSHKKDIIIGSGQPYEVIAKKHCPKVYQTRVKKGRF